MDSTTPRKVTEQEALYAEDAFEEHRRLGTTTRKCPWCGSEFRFSDASSGYRISCGSCTFRLTVRGI